MSIGEPGNLPSLNWHGLLPIAVALAAVANGIFTGVRKLLIRRICTKWCVIYNNISAAWGTTKLQQTALDQFAILTVKTIAQSQGSQNSNTGNNNYQYKNKLQQPFKICDATLCK